MLLEKALGDAYGTGDVFCVEIKCKVFEFPPRKVLHFFNFQQAKTLYL
jgi:hypothetical protein